jgi:hypothetical protein
MKNLLGVTAMLNMVLVATPAWACRIGVDQIIFAERPVPAVLDNAEVDFVHFSNEGDAFDRARTLFPRLADGRSLVGVAQFADAAMPVAVYAMVSSCTLGFFGNYPASRNEDAYIAGQWTSLPSGDRAFLAAGNLNGRWHD